MADAAHCRQVPCWNVMRAFASKDVDFNLGLESVASSRKSQESWGLRAAGGPQFDDVSRISRRPTPPGGVPVQGSARIEDMAGLYRYGGIDC